MTRMMTHLAMAWLALVGNSLAADKPPLVISGTPSELFFPQPSEESEITLNEVREDVLVDLHFQFVTVQGEIAKTPAVQHALDAAFAPKTLAKGGVLPPDRAKQFLRVCQNQPQVKVFADPSMRLPIGRSGRVKIGEEIPVAESGLKRFVGTDVQTAVGFGNPNMLRVLVELEHSHVIPPKEKQGLPGMHSLKQFTAVDLASGHTFVLRYAKGQLDAGNPNVTSEQMLLLTATLVDAKP